MSSAEIMAQARIRFVRLGLCKTCGARPRKNPDLHAVTGLYCDVCRASGAKRRTASRERAELLNRRK